MAKSHLLKMIITFTAMIVVGLLVLMFADILESKSSLPESTEVTAR